MLLAVGGLAACGPQASDAAVATDAVTSQAPAGGGKGECRRWTTCVPENPCHTGWVTGCRANVPICTDIGGWLSNGTTCGSAAVCYMGECEPCAAGESCTFARDMYGNPDVCRLGAIACGSGQPVCEYQGPAPDGTACGGGGPLVCKGGQCTWCQDGSSCTPPESPCHEGVVSACGTTGGTCTDTGRSVLNGNYCGEGHVCNGGECVACAWWSPCTPQESCWESGYTDCSTGSARCVPQVQKPDGTPCDGGGVCQYGACVQPCVPDQPCTPYNACYTGRTVCDPFYGAWCQEVAPVEDGTSCGVDAVCRSGSCSSCGASSWCPSPHPCYGSGTISCATGQCEPSPPPLPDGSTCGVAGESCQSGTCTDDADGRLVVRSASWAVDLTGTTWSHCTTAGEPGTSRRATDTYGLGTITHSEDTFASPDCSGAPQTTWTVNGTVTSAGDRVVGWAGGMPPPGAPWAPVTATAVRVTGEDPVMGPLDFKFLIWVNDWVGPRQLFQGEQDRALAPDGYPTLLVAETNPLQEVLACSAGEPCSPGYATCQEHATDCSSGAPACLPTGTVLPDGARCGDFLVCQAGACVPVPTRTVTGTSLLTYWPDGGPVATSDPAPLYSVSALQFASSTSGVVTRPGWIFPDGSFVIPDVAEGPYHLEISAPTGITYVALNTTNVVDLGMDLLGRQDVVSAATPTPVAFDVKGLVPWARGDVLEFASSNAGVAALPFGGQEAVTQPEGATQLTGALNWVNRPLVDGSAGDVGYVFQGATSAGPTGERVTVASGWAELSGLGFAFTDGVGGTVDVTLLPCPWRGALSADWRRGEFEAYVGQVHPEATAMNHRIVVGARPQASPFAPGFRSGELAQYPGLPLLVAQANPQTGDAVLADLGYGEFLPSLWREYRHDRLMAAVTFLAPGALRPARLNAPIGYDIAADAVAGNPAAPFVVAPIVTPPLGLTIGGMDAWGGVAGVGTTPRIAWTAPAVSPAAAVLFPGAALQYTIAVYEVRLAPDGTGTQLLRLFEAKTDRTAYRLPGTNLVPGGTYVVGVTASLTAESVEAPLRQSIEEAFATVLSREFTP